MHIVARARRHNDVGLAHQFARHAARYGCWQLLHQIARRTDAIEFGVHEFEQQRQRGLALGRWGEDDRVATLERVDDVVGGRRARVGRWRDCGNDTDRARYFNQPAIGIAVDHTHGLRALQITQQSHRLAPILGNLVCDIAESGGGNCKFGQRAIALRRDDCPCGRGDSFIDGVLTPPFVLALRGTGAGNQRCDDRVIP